MVGLHASTARRARRRCSATCASSGRRRCSRRPRIWENMLTGVQVRAADAPRAQALGVRALPRPPPSGRRSSARDGKPVPLGLRLQCALGEFFVYGPVRDQLGLRRAALGATPAARRSAPTPSASSAPSASTSSRCTARPRLTGLVSLQPDAEANPTTAGRPCPGIEVKIAERGEVLVQERGRLQGLLQERRGHARGHRRRRLVPHRRRRLRRPARPPGHHRPRQGRGRARRRHRLRAAVHREQAEVQPLHPRGGGLRARARRS